MGSLNCPSTPIPPVAQAAHSDSDPPVPLPLATDTFDPDHAAIAPTAHADAPLHPLRSCSTADLGDPCPEAMRRHAQTSTQQDHRTDEATRWSPPVRETWLFHLRNLCFLPHDLLHRFPTLASRTLDAASAAHAYPALQAQCVHMGPRYPSCSPLHPSHARLNCAHHHQPLHARPPSYPQLWRCSPLPGPAAAAAAAAAEGVDWCDGVEGGDLCVCPTF